NFLPLNDREYLAAGPGRTQSEVAKFSKKDAQQLDEFSSRLGAIADIVRGLLLRRPPNVVDGRWLDAISELIASNPLARTLSGLDMVQRRDLVGLFGQSAGDWLDSWFESDPIKALFGFDAIVGNYQSPYAPGTAYVLLHHSLGEVNGKKGVWGHAIGGMGAITQGMASACAALGVDIVTNAGVGEVIVEKGRARGVATEAGDSVRARAV